MKAQDIFNMGMVFVLALALSWIVNNQAIFTLYQRNVVINTRIFPTLQNFNKRISALEGKKRGVAPKVK